MMDRFRDLSAAKSRALAFGPTLFLAAAILTAPANDATAQLFGNPNTPTLAPLIEEISPAVVNISVSGSVAINNPLAQDPFFRRFLPPNEQQREFESAGSGVIVDADEGYILTNHHVVEDADRITVVLIDNRSLDAKIVGSDPGSDIAVLQVQSGNLTEMPLGNSDNVRVGDFVLAIGNPFRLQHTVTSGIVSGLGRRGITQQGSYEDFIQTDASINPGNSGGALVNLSGQLIGINSAILSGSGGNIGIGFAIPVNMASAVMDQIIEFGGVRRGLLGVNIVTVTSEIAESYELEATSGALVTLIADGSAAEAAGLQIGDVIVEVNGESVTDADGLRNAIGLMRPAETVNIGIIREGREETVVAVLGELDPDPDPLASLAEIDSVFEGADFATHNEQSPDYNGVAGILVTQVAPGSPAALRGLRAGDIVTHINRQRVRNISEAGTIISPARSVILQVQRGNRGVLILMR
ncbi:MAG TPA: Do family serine endopeptidase [Gammaproteobacteria bacterium]